MKEVDLRFVSQGPRPISISASLTEKEKSGLILLLKEFKDVFAWGYSENARMGSWVNSAYIECGPQGQASSPAYQGVSHCLPRRFTLPARVFHAKIEGAKF